MIGEILNNYKITKLSNGIRVASEKIDHVNSFSLGFWINVGSRDEILKNNGISHFLEHMFFKGTKKRSAKRISEDIESLGGYLNAFTSKEHTCFYGRGMKKYLEKTFIVLSDMIQDSIFDEKELKKEAKVVIDELHDIEDSPEELIFDKFETAIFKGNTLSMPIIGTENNVSNFSRDDLKNYISKNYNVNNFYVIASGNIDHDTLVKYTEKYLTGIKTSENKKRKIFKKNLTKDNYTYKDINQSHLIIGGTTFGYNNIDRAASNVISNILGEGSSSRLFQSLREKNGIAYQINTFMNSFYDISSFGVYLSTNEMSLKRARDIVLKEFEKIQTKEISSKELKRTKEYIKGHIQMSMESTSNRMMRMGHSLLYFNKIKTLEESMAEIDAITAEDILKHSKILLNPNNVTSVLISSNNLLN
ncbi:MAG: insulinase family protein [Ignavibacteriales bacterium]|nr:insulinase family protein [Ignavibacteriales bacterium]